MSSPTTQVRRNSSLYRACSAGSMTLWRHRRRDRRLRQGPPFRRVGRKGDVVKAVVVRTVKESRRADGSYISSTRTPPSFSSGRGPRRIVFGPVGRELREHKFKIGVSLAREVIGMAAKIKSGDTVKVIRGETAARKAPSSGALRRSTNRVEGVQIVKKHVP